MSSFENFEQLCEVSLNDILKKKQNKKTIAKLLWKIAEKDQEYANYLCYEMISEYYTSFRVNEIIHNIKNKQIGFDHPSFEKYKKLLKEYDDFLIEPPEVEEGVIECHSCGSKKTFSFSKQTRRADESATVFVRCSQCNKTFKI